LKKTHYVPLDGETKKLKLNLNFSESDIALLSPHTTSTLPVSRGVLVSTRTTVSEFGFFGEKFTESLVKLTMLIDKTVKASIKYCEEVLSRRRVH